MDREYIVTLHSKDDLEQFYNEMKLTNFPLVLKRPLSRNTHYMMTEEQAERLRQDPRVWGVERADLFQAKPQAINQDSYSISGDFWKDAPGSSTLNANLRQWGQLHCAGNQTQRRKGNWGDGSNPATETVNDTVNVFSDGKHVDVVIVDDPVSYDCEEWYSPTTNQTRFVQYQWFNELNTAVGSIDDDGQPLPSGTITYDTAANNPRYHGIHVTGTACGRHYGWAREANIYNIATTATWTSGQSIGGLLIFDYLRAFHLNKQVNPATGVKNPTITNHSYGGIFTPLGIWEHEGLVEWDILESVTWRGTTYSASNPNPSGWTRDGVRKDFPLPAFGELYIPAWSSAIAADVQDAIDDGVVIIGAAGNDNMMMAAEGDQDWDNYFTLRDNQQTNNTFDYWMCRGAWPNSPDSGAINVGALSDFANFRRSTYTQYGPGVDVFSPGDKILSSFNADGFTDDKYSTGNYFYPINGTSMASPQVCGIVACAASGKDRFTQEDARRYLQKTSLSGDMTFDANDSTILGAFDIFSNVLSSNGTGVFHIQNSKTNGGHTMSNGSPLVNNTNQPTLYMEVGDLIDIYGQDNNGLGYDELQTLTLQAVIFRDGPTYSVKSTSTNLYTVLDPGGTYIGSLQQQPPDDITASVDRAGVFSGSNQTYTVQVGDKFRILDNTQLNFSIAFKTSLGGNTVTSGTVTSGTDGNGDNWWQWDTAGVAPGTYYYQSGTSSAAGAIVVQAAGTYVDTATYNMCVKSALGPGTTNELPFDDTSNNQIYRSAATSDINSSPFVKIRRFVPDTPGTYYIQSDVHPNAYMTLIVSQPTVAGTFADRSCRKESPNLYLIAENPRQQTGNISEQIGYRSTEGIEYGASPNTGVSYQTFPRQAVFHRPAPALTSAPFPTRTFEFTVLNSGASDYRMTGVDAENGIFPTQSDPTINAYVGDTLVFNVNASGHPFLIKTSATTGTGNQVSTGTITNNGTQSGTVTWDTTGVTPGTYYYICQFHGGMVGQIVISQPPAQPTYATVMGNWLNSSIISSVGYDRNGQFQNTLGMIFNFNVGDIIKFQLNNMSGHPIWIKTSSTIGTGDAVTTGTITNNGSDVGPIIWDTTGVTPGTYHYQCQVHDSMDGRIIIS